MERIQKCVKYFGAMTPCEILEKLPDLELWAVLDLIPVLEKHKQIRRATGRQEDCRAKNCSKDACRDDTGRTKRYL